MANIRPLKSLSPSRVRLASEEGDPLVSAVSAWEAKRYRLDAMIFEWQGLEDKLSYKARELRVDLAEACHGDLPEARAMRALNSKIGETERKLRREVSEIRNMRVSTLLGAVAKVRLGLAAQGKFDWQENARELIEEGIEELNALLVRASTELTQPPSKNEDRP